MEYPAVWFKFRKEVVIPDVAKQFTETPNGYTLIESGKIYDLEVWYHKDKVTGTVGEISDINRNNFLLLLMAAEPSFPYLHADHQVCLHFSWIKSFTPVTLEDLPLYLGWKTYPYMEKVIKRSLI